MANLTLTQPSDLEFEFLGWFQADSSYSNDQWVGLGCIEWVGFECILVGQFFNPT